jgi:hypothetical protein
MNTTSKMSTVAALAMLAPSDPVDVVDPMKLFPGHGDWGKYHGKRRNKTNPKIKRNKAQKLARRKNRSKKKR